MPDRRRRFRYSIGLTSLAIAVALTAACRNVAKDRPAAERDARSADAVKTALQKEIELSLTLETVLDNTKKDLAEAEQSNPRDEAHIEERKMAVKAVTARLEESRRAIVLLRARGK